MQVTRANAIADDGIIIVNKEKDMTSHDVVSCMRKLANTRKVGHGGTLDPMATGVLVVAVGKATRMLQYIFASWKTYRATVLLGVRTVSDDAMGEVLEITPVDEQGLQDKIDAILPEFRGDILQAPSKVSAIKVHGKRAYDLVREGKEVELEKRPVTIYSLEQISSLRASSSHENAYEFDIEVTCSSGTYIRSIARDIGEKLECGAHLTMLERTNVGGFTLEEAKTLQELNRYVSEQNACDCPKSVETIPLAKLAMNMFPYSYVSKAQREKICVGAFLPYEDFMANLSSNENAIEKLSEKVSRENEILPKNKHKDSVFAAIYEENSHSRLVALMTPKGKFVKPVCVFDV